MRSPKHFPRCAPKYSPTCSLRCFPRYSLKCSSTHSPSCSPTHFPNHFPRRFVFLMPCSSIPRLVFKVGHLFIGSEMYRSQKRRIKCRYICYKKDSSKTIVDGYAGLRKRKELNCVTSIEKLRKFSVKFTNKAKSRLVKVKERHEQRQIDLVDMEKH